MDCFSKLPTACIFVEENGPNVTKFWAIQVKNFCNRQNIVIFKSPINDHRAIELVERLIQTIKNRIACINVEKGATNSFHLKRALTIIVNQMRRLEQKIAFFEAHFGRNPNAPLSVICTTSKLFNFP